MSKHTPGPWAVAMIRSSQKWREVRTAQDGETIASVSTARAEVDANTRLIAAAPELLQSLKKCDDAFVHWQTGTVPGRPEDILALIQEVRAAIAKAEGKS